jgi:hypothetical protein
LEAKIDMIAMFPNPLRLGEDKGELVLSTLNWIFDLLNNITVIGPSIEASPTQSVAPDAGTKVI